MAQLDIVGTRSGGPESYVSGLQDSIAEVVAGQIRVYTAGFGATGGVLAWRGADTSPFDTEPLAGSSGLGAQTGLVIAALNGRDALLVHGPAGAGITAHWIGSDGRLSAGTRIASGPDSIQALTGSEAGFFYSTARDAGGLTIWRSGADDQLSQVDRITPEAATASGALVALETLRLVSGQEVLLAASAEGPGLISFRLGSDGRPNEVDRVAASDGLQIATPTVLTTARVDGQDYALIGAAGTGSISVVALDGAGALRVTDQVNDDLATRFQSIAALEVAMLSDRAFVLAGGGDDGLSVLELLPGGRLLHRATLADPGGTALTDITSLSVVAQNDDLIIFATGEGAGGITELRFDPGVLGVTLTAQAQGGALAGGDGGDVLVGADGDDDLAGGAGDDILIDGAGQDRMWGGTGADVFVFRRDGAADRVMDFELGTDRLDLSDLGRAYTIDAFDLRAEPNGLTIGFGGEDIRLIAADGRAIDPAAVRVTDLLDLWHIAPTTAPDPDDLPPDPRHVADETIAGSSGQDVLRGDPEDPAFDPLSAQVYRLFRATLARDPDPHGVVGWVDWLSGGNHTLTETAGGFTNSREFQDSYGGATDAEFVTLLYNNVLGRDPAPDGLAYWTGQLATGAMDRTEVVIGFSESREFIETTAAAALEVSRAGLRAGWTDEVFRLYQVTLGRDPDVGGLLGWSEHVARGMTLEQAAQGFTQSAEFQLRYGATTDSEFVALLFHNVLGRDPAPAGLAGWTARLADGSYTRAEVVVAFSQAAEFIDNSTDGLIDFMRGLGTDDRIIGGGGDDVLFGGALSDAFVFDTLQPGHDRVVGLDAWDRIELVGFDWSLNATPEDHLSQGADGVIFSAQGVEVTFQGTVLAQITPDMFWIS